MQRQTDELLLLDALTLAVLATDGSGFVTFANDAAATMFARTADELIGSHVVDLVALGPGEEPALPNVLNAVRWRGDVTVHRTGGDDLLAEATVNPIVDVDGGVVGAIAVLEDMTEIRRPRPRQPRARPGSGSPTRPPSSAPGTGTPSTAPTCGTRRCITSTDSRRAASTAPGTPGSAASTRTSARRPSASCSRRWRTSRATCSATGSSVPTARPAGSRHTARSSSVRTAVRPGPSAASRT